MLMCTLLILLAGCNPRIYQFDVSPLTAGLDDTINLNWTVKGEAVLLVHDLNYPGQGSGSLADITLLVTRDGKTLAYTLHAADTLKLPLAASGGLRISKKQDSIQDDRLRYFKLVARKGKTQTDSVKQVAVRPDFAADEIAFIPFVRGDSLIAQGTNNPVRWGTHFSIRTVAAGGGREIDVYHLKIFGSLIPGDKPDPAFTGTPVHGYWQFRTLLTADEKNKIRPIPKLIKILITIKHNANVPAKH